MMIMMISEADFHRSAIPIRENVALVDVFPSKNPDLLKNTKRRN